MSRPLTQVLGYPRIGENRELKKATESYWKGEITQAELLAVGQAIRAANWQLQAKAGVDIIPSNDFCFYDQMLEMTCLVGNVPPRFNWSGTGMIDLDTRFTIARGVAKEKNATVSHHASDMTKWFDTNYHYIVPEFHAGTKFKLSSTKVFDEFQEAKALSILTKPVLIGPVTYLTLGKVHDPSNPSFDRFTLLESLLPVYVEVLTKLAELGAKWVQLDEPIFATDLSIAQRSGLARAYALFAEKVPSPLKLMVATYFGSLDENLQAFVDLPVAALHCDATRSSREDVNHLVQALKQHPRKPVLSVGIVDGRNIWRSDLSTALTQLKTITQILGVDRVIVAPSCSLQHTPVTLRNEKALDAELKSWMCYAEEKLSEITTLALALGPQSQNAKTALDENEKAIASRRSSTRVHRKDVELRVRQVKPEDAQRHSPFAIRQAAQRARLHLPLLPTTTIGSFPQTAEVRAARAQWKSRKLTNDAYEKFLEEETKKAVKIQENLGLDMLVHGEFERNDMVEYFGEQIEGYVFTQNGWVQSYGSRYVKPPVIFGDVSRPHAMTVRWSSFAQSLTPKPMKGMLSGPITMLQWSFVRDDQPRKDTALQIALALRDEVTDLEEEGIAAIQIDEPALREGLPLRRKNWEEYLDWAVRAFRITASGVRDDTQIHTHMCYAEFNDIIRAIAALDADVITIETSRSNMELLGAFVDFKYPLEIGPGVYDIHSPRVPSLEEMEGLMEKAIHVLPIKNLWVNPDCGLKTRNWPETTEALTRLVQCAKKLRIKYADDEPAEEKKA